MSPGLAFNKFIEQLKPTRRSRAQWRPCGDRRALAGSARKTRLKVVLCISLMRQSSAGSLTKQTWVTARGTRRPLPVVLRSKARWTNAKTCRGAGALQLCARGARPLRRRTRMVWRRRHASRPPHLHDSRNQHLCTTQHPCPALLCHLTTGLVCRGGGGTPSAHVTSHHVPHQAPAHPNLPVGRPSC